MKSSLALLATAAAVGATFTKTEWIVDVVTVTRTVDPTDGVQTSQSTSTPTPEPFSTSSATPSPPSPISAVAEEPQFITTTTTTTEAPPPTSTIEPEPVVQTSTPEPQPETTTKPQPSSQPEPETPTDGYQGTAVKYHNAYREDHSAGNLSWDSKLAALAQELAETCVFAHNTTMGGENYHYGQNLAMAGTTGDLGSMDSAVGKASKDWYAEVKDYGNSYGQKNPSPSGMTGHFTQMVWKNTETVGCATVKCTWQDMPSLYTVCNYGPPGNVQGEYSTNVLPSLGLKVSL